MVVYLEAHPIVLDVAFAACTICTLVACCAKVLRTADRMRVEVLKGIQSRNDLLREGFATLAGMLSNRPCLKPIGSMPVEEHCDKPLVLETIESKEDA